MLHLHDDYVITVSRAP